RACRKSRVLYIELENGNVETKKRITGILAQKGIDEDLPDSLFIYCLKRGFVDSYVSFFDEIIEKVVDNPFDLIIIDPIYMLLDGDENNSEVIREFFKQISRLKTATGASIIMCHHESKGCNSAKNVVDRASGSGVLSRYPDALISLEPANMSALYRAKIKMVLRYFKSPEPLNVNFKDGAFLLNGESTEKNNKMNSSSDLNKSKKEQFVVDRMRNEGR
ncbi:MAG: AAA family ATPase, partial [Acutalibacteraceae bacterium]